MKSDKFPEYDKSALNMSILVDLKHSLIQYATFKSILIICFGKQVSKTQEQKGLNKVLLSIDSDNIFYMMQYNDLALHSHNKIHYNGENIKFEDNRAVVLKTYRFALKLEGTYGGKTL
jgi:hypothetical protein